MAGYIGTTPVPQATQHRESFTATGGQTSFATVGYTPQFIDVYLNGVKLAPADYTATNGSDVVLASGATASDILEIVAYTPFEIASQTFTGDTTANNFAVTGTFTSRGIDDNADAVAITIDSSENVGIGTASPDQNLTIGAGGKVRLYRGDNTRYGDIYTDNNFLNIETSNDPIKLGGPSYIRFDTNSTERMRIDASGNLLVGKTTTSTADQGIQINPSGRIDSTSNGAEALRLNRKTSDGDILQFRKDNTTVGSIGAGSGRIAVGNGNTFVTFAGDLNALYPASASSTTPRDNAVDIGTSGTRFKDLYLSGGVYLGGTGAANKLDDYEEGTWTPVSFNATSATYSHQSGSYVKVGGLVFIRGRMTLTSLGDGSATRIGGLPFTQSDEATINVSKLINCADTFYYFGLRVAGTTLYGHIQDGLDSTMTTNVSFLGNSTEIQFSGTYQTDA